MAASPSVQSLPSGVTPPPHPTHKALWEDVTCVEGGGKGILRRGCEDWGLGEDDGLGGSVFRLPYPASFFPLFHQVFLLDSFLDIFCTYVLFLN